MTVRLRPSSLLDPPGLSPEIYAMAELGVVVADDRLGRSAFLYQTLQDRRDVQPSQAAAWLSGQALATEVIDASNSSPTGELCATPWTGFWAQVTGRYGKEVRWATSTCRYAARDA